MFEPYEIMDIDKFEVESCNSVWFIPVCSVQQKCGLLECVGRVIIWT